MQNKTINYRKIYSQGCKLLNAVGSTYCFADSQTTRCETHLLPHSTQRGTYSAVLHNLYTQMLQIRTLFPHITANYAIIANQ